MKTSPNQPKIQGTRELLLEYNKNQTSIASLLHDTNRHQHLQRQVLGLHLDASRSSIPSAAISALYQLAQEARISLAIQALFHGDIVNQSEQRPALHMALRAEEPQTFLPGHAGIAVAQARSQLIHWADCFHAGLRPNAITADKKAPLSDLIHIGIGGSDLGARMLAAALPNTRCQPRLHFISAPDPHLWRRITAQADPQRSAVIITTKSFNTVETLSLATAAQEWLGAEHKQRMFAVSAAVDKAASWVPREQVLPMWDWTGGRFSLWSCAGIMGAVAVGAQTYTELLQGAAAMDQHFLSSPLAHNLPLAMALYDYWHHSIQGYPLRGIYVYDQRLQLVPDWLRQLEMESLGKQVQQNGKPVDGPSAAMLIGGSGPDAQHAIFQALHQGTRPWPVELVLIQERDDQHPQLQRLQWASMLAQAQALTQGVHHSDDPARELPGNRSVLQWALSDLQATTLGAWLAAYEHKVYSLACLWGINAFDQWGVEEGKRLARLLMEGRQEDRLALDPTTQRWLEQLHWWQN